MSKRRIAARLIWLPDDASPPEGRNSSDTEFPFAGFSTRPGVSVVTRPVLSHIPGSAADPSVTFVVPSVCSPLVSTGATAAARSSSVVVSNSSTVRAAGGGGGGGVGSSVSTGTTSSAGSGVDGTSCQAGSVHAARPRIGRINTCLMPGR